LGLPDLRKTRGNPVKPGFRGEGNAPSLQRDPTVKVERRC